REGGGGLFNLGTTTLTDCTISGNTAVRNHNSPDGGGLYNGPGHSLMLTNCTVSGNSAIDGGGLSNVDGPATLINCTVSGNTAAFVSGMDSYTIHGGATTLINTIVAGNTASLDTLELTGSFSGTNNLIGGNPVLAPLGNYGGPTPTMALLPGSPAINAGT